MRTFRQLLESIKLPPKSDAPQKVIDDFEAQTTPHPLNPNVRMTNDGVGVELSNFGSMVHISSIVSHHQKGAGHASKALKTITDLADKHGATIGLMSVPIRNAGAQGPTMTKTQLDDWYGRHGFEGDTHRFRKPRTVIKLTGFKRQH